MYVYVGVCVCVCVCVLDVFQDKIHHAYDIKKRNKKITKE